MNQKSVFSGPVLAILIAGATAIFALSLLLMLTAPSDRETVASDTRSISAIGQAGWYELAQRAGIPVARSRINGIEAPGEGGLLVMAEPPSSLSGGDIIRLGNEKNVLLVLPKRWGERDGDNPAWVRATGLIGIAPIAQLARLVEPDVSITRGAAPKSWAVNRIGIDPSFDGNAQLIRSDSLTPLIGGADGMLLGEKADGEQRVWVLADPDIIENHGLTKGRNADFALALLDGLRDGDGRVVFDETIHGMVNVVESPFRALFAFPYVIVVLLGLAAAGLLLWATASRFGKPRAAPPAFDLGKGRLIGNTASLLDRAGHQAFVLRRYVLVTLRDAGRVFHAPPQLGDEDLAAWLDAIGKARRIDAHAVDILARSRADRHLAGLFRAARDMHQWKNRITHGTSAHSDGR